jgi:hypothetical protein
MTITAAWMCLYTKKMLVASRILDVIAKQHDACDVTSRLLESVDVLVNSGS